MLESFSPPAILSGNLPVEEPAILGSTQLIITDRPQRFRSAVTLLLNSPATRQHVSLEGPPWR